MNPENRTPILECRSLNYCYEEGLSALADVNFHADKGEFVALVASNGSGKTTLIKVLAGLLTPRSGEVLIRGSNIFKMSDGQRYGQIGLLLQNPRDQLFGMTVDEDVAFGPRNQGLSDEAVAERLNHSLESVGGSHLKGRAIHHLSFGEQKRVALAGVLAMRPAILLLDEATAGLDPAGENQMIHLLKRLNDAEGITVVFATHSIDLLPLFAHRIYVLDKGRVLMCATTEKIFNDPENLDRAGLRLPYISSLFHEMKERDGLSINELPLTLQAARREILSLLPERWARPIEKSVSKSQTAGPTDPDVAANDSKTSGRLGYTTGACAAAAAKAALYVLLTDGSAPQSIDIPFPDGQHHILPVVSAGRKGTGAEAAVRKDAGDDPDITDGCIVTARVDWFAGAATVFAAGEGIGTVTKKGLVIPPGEPAINPGPRKMIVQALRELSDRPVRVTISIPGGAALAQKTFNPRLGITNGLSILGTTGRVRPFSSQALKCSVICELNVAKAAGVTAPVLVPGHIGEYAAREKLRLADEQIIEVGNAWGFLVDRLSHYPFRQVLIWGHPGKLAKLADGQWDTHSAGSRPAIDYVRCLDGILGPIDDAETATTEGFFSAKSLPERHRLACTLCAEIARAVEQRTKSDIDIAVVLINMAGDILGTYGDVSPWKPRNNIK